MAARRERGGTWLRNERSSAQSATDSPSVLALAVMPLRNALSQAGLCGLDLARAGRALSARLDHGPRRPRTNGTVRSSVLTSSQSDQLAP